MIKAIVGANWGDEGKGKIADICAAYSDIVVRFQGGSNAGHTIINHLGKFALHQLPSGIFRENTLNVITNNFALNIDYLLREIESVNGAGVHFNLMISGRTGVLTPYHVLLDELEENRLGDRKFGSTKSGIAPFYSDKYAKTGLQLWELYEEKYLREKIEGICEKLNVLMEHFYKAEKVDAAKLYDHLRESGQKVEKYIGDTGVVLNKAIREGQAVLLEGQLGALRDIDHGIYPYVTSSSTLAANAAVSAGIPPYKITDVMAVTKAYSSAVGEGPFVTEIFGDDATELRNRGGDAGEYGATTGRPRRVGYFDAVATRYGAQVQGATELVITGLDVLSYMEEVPVCVAYDVDGEKSGEFPVTSKLQRAVPVYERLPGWKVDIRGITEYKELPVQVKDYIAFIQDKVGVKVNMVSNGPRRDEIIYI